MFEPDLIRDIIPDDLPDLQRQARDGLARQRGALDRPVAAWRRNAMAGGRQVLEPAIEFRLRPSPLGCLSSIMQGVRSLWQRD